MKIVGKKENIVTHHMFSDVRKKFHDYFSVSNFGVNRVPPFPVAVSNVLTLSTAFQSNLNQVCMVIITCEITLPSKWL